MGKQLKVALAPKDAAVYDAALSLCTPLQARTLASNVTENDLLRMTEHLSPGSTQEALKLFMQASTSSLKNPAGIPDIKIAAEAIVDALELSRPIVLAGDFDCDGATSVVCSTLFLRDIFGHPEDKIIRAVPHRMKNGYGLSDSLVDEILELNLESPLVVTMDCGSSDEERIARLKEHGIETIVTDHHGIPEEGIPKSAIAVVSPAREDSTYGDPYIAGCMVIALTMLTARSVAESRSIPLKNEIEVGEILAYSAVGTLADCVSMSQSINNRIIVKHGLSEISKRKRPCWDVLLGEKEEGVPFLSEDIGFNLGPLINSAGRISHPDTAIRFLLAESNREASELLAALKQENSSRKEIEKQMRVKALEELNGRVESDQWSITHFMPDGHPGVHGIVASRLVERFGVPVAVFSPSGKGDGIATGSLRSVDGIHVRDALAAVKMKSPDMLISMGGHAGASGCKIKESSIEEFTKLFEEAVRSQSPSKAPQPTIVTLPLSDDAINIDTASELEQMEPFGRGFLRPTFQVEAKPSDIKLMGEDLTHVSMKLGQGRFAAKAVWFNFEDAYGQELVEPDKPIKLVGQISKNYWKGRVYPQFITRAATQASPSLDSANDAVEPEAEQQSLQM